MRRNLVLRILFTTCAINIKKKNDSHFFFSKADKKKGTFSQEDSVYMAFFPPFLLPYIITL